MSEVTYDWSNVWSMPGRVVFFYGPRLFCGVCYVCAGLWSMPGYVVFYMSPCVFCDVFHACAGRTRSRRPRLAGKIR